MTLPYTTNNPVVPQELGPAAVVVVGEVEFDDQKAKFLPASKGTVWADFEMYNRYENDGHRYMMGITSPQGFNGASSAFVQLAAPTLMWVCDWTAMKQGDVPDIPDPVAYGSWVLLDIHLELPDVNVAADGVTPVYRVSGVYFYGNLAPNYNVFANVVFPKPPYLEDGAGLRLVPYSKVVHNISDYATTTGPTISPGGPTVARSQF